MCPDVLKKQVAALKAAGLDIEATEVNNQWYVVVRTLAAPSPPWERTAYDVAIAIPAAYDDAALDGFYLGLPYKHADGQHQRVNGGKITFLERDWQLVSWHYPDGKPWQSGRDSLETHIAHCRGFFLHRGAINDYH
jgi:hypothetical protein